MLVTGDSIGLEMADFGARIVASVKGDSLTGRYSNVGRRGPRDPTHRVSRFSRDCGRRPQQHARGERKSGQPRAHAATVTVSRGGK